MARALTRHTLNGLNEAFWLIEREMSDEELAARTAAASHHDAIALHHATRASKTPSGRPAEKEKPTKAAYTTVNVEPTSKTETPPVAADHAPAAKAETDEPSDKTNTTEAPVLAKKKGWASRAADTLRAARQKVSDATSIRNVAGAIGKHGLKIASALNPLEGVGEHYKLMGLAKAVSSGNVTPEHEKQIADTAKHLGTDPETFKHHLKGDGSYNHLAGLKDLAKTIGRNKAGDFGQKVGHGLGDGATTFVGRTAGAAANYIGDKAVSGAKALKTKMADRSLANKSSKLSQASASLAAAKSTQAANNVRVQDLSADRSAALAKDPHPDRDSQSSKFSANDAKNSAAIAKAGKSSSQSGASALASRVGSKLSSAKSAFTDKAKSGLSNLYSKGKSVAGSVAAGAASKARTIGTSVANTAGSAASRVASGVGSMAGNASRQLGRAKAGFDLNREVAREKIGDVKDNASRALSSASKKVSGAVSGAASLARNTFKKQQNPEPMGNSLGTKPLDPSKFTTTADRARATSNAVIGAVKKPVIAGKEIASRAIAAAKSTYKSIAQKGAGKLRGEFGTTRPASATPTKPLLPYQRQLMAPTALSPEYQAKIKKAKQAFHSPSFGASRILAKYNRG